MGVLRLLLALVVVVHHIPHYISGNHSFPGAMASLDAMVAVLVFFVFSGFYMSFVLNEKYAHGHNYPLSFYFGRALRIFPLYWMVLLLSLLYDVSTGRAGNVDNIAHLNGVQQTFQIFMNVTTLGLDLVPSLGGYTFQLIGPAWSLGTELLFYMVAPWCVRLRPRTTVILIVAIVAVRVALVVAGGDRYPFRVLFFPLSLCFFLLGHLSYLLWARIRGSALLVSMITARRLGIWTVGAVIASAFVLDVGRGIDPDTWRLWTFYLLVTLAMPVIFIDLAKSRVDKFLGDLTFPLYVSHCLVLIFVNDFVRGGEVPTRWIALAASLGLAVLFTLTIERPMERLRSAVSARLRKTPGLPAMVPLGQVARRRLAVAGVLALPVIAIAMWHLQNHRLPADDAANFTTTAFQIFARFSDGMYSGLAAVYELRGWRPTGFPVLLLPFLALTGGHVIAAVGMALTVLYAALVAYVYRLARLFVSRPRAVITAVAVCTVPAFSQWGIVFFSELAWLVCSVACLYHWLASHGQDSRANQKWWAGVWLGLMAVIRPIESLAVMAFPVAWLVGRSVRDGSLSKRDLMMGAAATVLTAVVLAGSLAVAWPRALILALALLPQAVFFLAMRRGGRQVPPTLAAVAVACVIGAVWWAGFVRALYDWAYLTSFGDMARVTDQRSAHSSVFTVARRLVSSYGAVQFAVLGVLAVVPVLAGRVMKANPLPPPAQPERTTIRPVTVLLLGALMFLPMLALLGWSGTGDPRRVLPAMTLMLTGLALSSLAAAARWWRGLTVATLLVLAVVQSCLLFSTPLKLGWEAAALKAVGNALDPPAPAPDWNVAAIDELQKVGVPAGSAVAVYTEALFKGAARRYEPASLQLASTMKASPFAFGYLWDEGEPTRVVERLRAQGYAYLLLDSFDDPDVRASGLPYVKFTAALLDLDGARRQLQLGLHELATFDMGGRRQTVFALSSAAAAAAGAPVDPTVPIAVASSAQRGFPSRNINDGSDAAWGSDEVPVDVFAGLDLRKPQVVHELQVRLFTPDGRAHLRDVRIVVADELDGDVPRWRVIPGRLAGSGGPFDSRVTVPLLPDNTTVTIEADAADAAFGAHRFWGLACLSASKQDRRNYLPVGLGVYFRELTVR